MPLGGRLLLAGDERLAGIACPAARAGHRRDRRMYTATAPARPGSRAAQRLLEEAAQIGYERVRLDSAAFMHEAHQLYRAMFPRD
jgi:hypothetical protein